MTDAPERIWARPGMPGYVSDGPVEDVYDVEYIRADIAAAERNTHIELLEKWVHLAKRTLRDHASSLDANRQLDFEQGIRETSKLLKPGNTK